MSVSGGTSDLVGVRLPAGGLLSTGATAGACVVTLREWSAA